MASGKTNATATIDRQRPELNPGRGSSNVVRPGNGRARRRSKSASSPGLPGLRWVPVPLAMLMAALGWLVLGSVLGQHAAASDHFSGLQAGGLGLTVNESLWMSDSMSGPGQTTSKGYVMPSSMMPGMQAPGDKRLRIEVYIRNISTGPQRYALSEFRLFGPGGKSWKIVGNDTTKGAAQSAVLAPGFQATVDLYFDIPATQSKHLSVRWSHGGSTVTFPVHPAGTDSTSVMVGM